ncbi:MAG: DUF423 domain-containing protein [Flavobacteriales bacterium]|nr:DUF423 domain-containing protein [Flavobacteriales bacterium]
MTKLLQNRIILWSGISGALAVALGALGAHKIVPMVSEAHGHAFTTATQYHMFHSLALLALAALSDKINERWLRISFLAFLAGIVCFSGSLYLLSTREITGLAGLMWLGPVTPLGGLMLITGWLCLVLGVRRTS